MKSWKYGIVGMLCGTAFGVIAQTAQVAGVVTQVQGQRLEITVKDGTKQWVSVRNADILLDASYINKTVTANVTKVGDALVLDKPVFSN